MTPASAPSTAANQPATSLGYAWYVVIVLTALYMLSFVDRTILSLLVGSIKRDLGISDTRIGLLQGLVVRAVLHHHGPAPRPPGGHAQPAQSDRGRRGGLEPFHQRLQCREKFLVAVLHAHRRRRGRSGTLARSVLADLRLFSA